MFKFSQATLLKIRKIKADQALQAFALSQRHVLACKQNLSQNDASRDSLESEMAARLNEGIKARELLLLEDFHASLRFNGQALVRELAEADLEVEERRQDLLKAKTELKAMERLREIELERYQAEINRREMLFIDEIAVTRHGKTL
jgi:flagellar export protein FliJ